MMKNVVFKIIELNDWSMISLKKRLKEVTSEFKEGQTKVKIKHHKGWYTAQVFKIK